MPKTHHLLTLDRKTLGALKAMLRFQFIDRMTAHMAEPKPPGGSLQADARYRALAVVSIVDAFDDIYEPTRFLEAAFDLTNSNEGVVPVRDDVFNALKRVVDSPIPVNRFEALTNEEVDAMIAPLRQLQEELRMLFNAAEPVDPTEVPKHHWVNVGSTKRKPDGGGNPSMLN